MPGGELLGRPDVEQGHLALAHPGPQRGLVHGLQLRVGGQEVPGGLGHLGEARLGDLPDRPQQVGHRGVGQAVGDEEPLLAGLDQPGAAEHLRWAEVLASVMSASRASASTVRGPCESSSTSSTRWALASAFPRRANCS